MRKYTPLYDYLRRKPCDVVTMTFADVERVISGLLPKSAFRPQWCANEQSPDTRHVQCSAWIDAGFEAVPSVGNEKVVFRRTGVENYTANLSTSPHDILSLLS